MHTVPDSWRVPIMPRDVPGLVAFWDMQGRGAARAATAGEAYVLAECGGTVERVRASGAPFGAYAARFDGTAWFQVGAGEAERLDVHGSDGRLTLIAWIRRATGGGDDDAFVAGAWEAARDARQYGLFVGAGAWGGADRGCALVSPGGGPTPGYRVCVDGAVGAGAVPTDTWQTVAMTYDGIQAALWRDGLLDAQPGRNPYPLAGGLHAGAAAFTVGAIAGGSGAPARHAFHGLIGGLAVYDRVLTPAELYAVAGPAPGAGGPVRADAGAG